MVNLVVAFGFADDAYFITAGNRYHRSNIPQGMSSEIHAKIETPFDFVSIGDDGKWFMLGRDPENSEKRLTHTSELHTGFNTGNLTTLHTRVTERPTSGVCFGPDNSWTWHVWDGKTYYWAYEGLGQEAISFINGRTKNQGSEFKIIIGAGNATVLLYLDGAVWYHSCGDYLADTLSASISQSKNLSIRYLALSPTHADWFFIQFEDDSVTWYTSTVMGERILAFAKDQGLVFRRPRTLEKLE